MALPAGSPLLLLPLRECGLRLLPAGARPRWINQLHPQEQLALPSGLAEHLLGSLHKACVVGQGYFGHGGWRSCAWGRPIAMLPQQPTGLVFVLLGDDLPPLISQQCHKEPTRRIPNPPRMHSSGHHVQLGRLAALQPAACSRLLVQGEQAVHIVQSASVTLRKVGGVSGSARGYRLGEAYVEPWGRMVVGSLALALAVARPLSRLPGSWRVLAWSAQSPPGCMQPLDGRAVGTAAHVPKAKRHDYLPGAQGDCNAACLPSPSSSRRRVHQLMPRSRSSSCSRTLRSPCPRPSSGSITRISRWNSPARGAARSLRATPVPGP